MTITFFYGFIRKRFQMLRSMVIWNVLIAFIAGLVSPLSCAQAQVTSVVSSAFIEPPVIKGLSLIPNKPFEFNFIVAAATASADEPKEPSGDEGFPQKEYLKLIKYFLAGLAIPEQDLWVNLNPNEPDRIIPQTFGKTDMGHDLLAQDYVLKQLSASLLSPESETGKKFWEKMYEKAYASSISHLAYGQEQPNANDQMLNAIQTLSRVWIVPDDIQVFENGDRVFITRATLKVLLEDDYLNRSSSTDNPLYKTIIPVLNREVNEGEAFAPLRQIYHSLILATWYKRKLKDSILTRIYADQQRINGIALDDKNQAQKIYDQYLKAFRSGVSDMIREEYDPETQTVVPKHYFTGGAKLALQQFNHAQLVPEFDNAALSVVHAGLESFSSHPIFKDAAMMSELEQFKDVIKARAETKDKEWIEEVRNQFRQKFGDLDVYPSFSKTFLVGDQSYKSELVRDERGQFIYARLNHIFFIDPQIYLEMPDSLKEKLGSNVILYPINKSNAEGGAALIGYAQYSLPIMASMIHNGVENLDVVDYGAGDGVLGLFAHKLGSKFVDLLEVEPTHIQAAEELYELNGVEKGVDFDVHKVDLLKVDQVESVWQKIADRVQVSGRKIAVVANIGHWGSWAFKNSTLIEQIKNIPFVQMIILGGYIVRHLLNSYIVSDREMAEQAGFVKQEYVSEQDKMDQPTAFSAVRNNAAMMNAVDGFDKKKLSDHLSSMGNTPEEIEKFFEWIGDAKHPPIMEVLGGDTSNAVALAEAGRAAGQRVIVIDNYWIENDSLKDWNKRQLPAHRYDGDNLLSLRMDIKYLEFLPSHSLHRLVAVAPNSVNPDDGSMETLGILLKAGVIDRVLVPQGELAVKLAAPDGWGFYHYMAQDYFFDLHQGLWQGVDLTKYSQAKSSGYAIVFDDTTWIYRPESPQHPEMKTRGKYSFRDYWLKAMEVFLKRLKMDNINVYLDRDGIFSLTPAGADDQPSFCISWNKAQQTSIDRVTWDIQNYLGQVIGSFSAHIRFQLHEYLTTEVSPTFFLLLGYSDMMEEMAIVEKKSSILEAKQWQAIFNLLNQRRPSHIRFRRNARIANYPLLTEKQLEVLDQAMLSSENMDVQVVVKDIVERMAQATWLDGKKNNSVYKQQVADAVLKILEDNGQNILPIISDQDNAVEFPDQLSLKVSEEDVRRLMLPWSAKNFKISVKDNQDVSLELKIADPTNPNQIPAHILEQGKTADIDAYFAFALARDEQNHDTVYTMYPGVPSSRQWPITKKVFGLDGDITADVNSVLIRYWFRVSLFEFLKKRGFKYFCAVSKRLEGESLFEQEFGAVYNSKNSTVRVDLNQSTAINRQPEGAPTRSNPAMMSGGADTVVHHDLEDLIDRRIKNTGNQNLETHRSEVLDALQAVLRKAYSQSSNTQIFYNNNYTKVPQSSESLSVRLTANEMRVLAALWLEPGGVIKLSNNFNKKADRFLMFVLSRGGKIVLNWPLRAKDDVIELGHLDPSYAQAESELMRSLYQEELRGVPSELARDVIGMARAYVIRKVLADMMKARGFTRMEVRITAKTEEAKQRAKNYLINELGFQGEVGERVVNTVYADLDDLSRGLPDLAMMAESDWDPEPLRQELIKNGNDPKQVEIFLQWLQDEKIPFNLEVGAGRARSTRALADRYPGQRFVAGDLYAMSGEYSQTATEWAEKKLDAQKNKPDNLLILRFGIEALKYFPPKSVNQILALRPDYPLQRDIRYMILSGHLDRVLKTDGQLWVMHRSNDFPYIYSRLAADVPLRVTDERFMGVDLNPFSDFNFDYSSLLKKHFLMENLALIYDKQDRPLNLSVNKEDLSQTELGPPRVERLPDYWKQAIPLFIKRMGMDQIYLKKASDGQEFELSSADDQDFSVEHFKFEWSGVDEEDPLKSSWNIFVSSQKDQWAQAGRVTVQFIRDWERGYPDDRLLRVELGVVESESGHSIQDLKSLVSSGFASLRHENLKFLWPEQLRGQQGRSWTIYHDGGWGYDILEWLDMSAWQDARPEIIEFLKQQDQRRSVDYENIFPADPNAMAGKHVMVIRSDIMNFIIGVIWGETLEDAWPHVGSSAQSQILLKDKQVGLRSTFLVEGMVVSPHMKDYREKYLSAIQGKMRIGAIGEHGRGYGYLAFFKGVIPREVFSTIYPNQILTDYYRFSVSDLSDAAMLHGEENIYADLRKKLLDFGNDLQEIDKFISWIEESADHPLVGELGAGSGDATLGKARKQPSKRFVALDLLNGYGEFLRPWEKRELPIQRAGLENAIYLRAGADIIRYLPENVFEEIFVIAPDRPFLKELGGFLHEGLFEHILRHNARLGIWTLDENIVDFIEMMNPSGLFKSESLDSWGFYPNQSDFIGRNVLSLMKNSLWVMHNHKITSDEWYGSSVLDDMQVRDGDSIIVAVIDEDESLDGHIVWNIKKEFSGSESVQAFGRVTADVQRTSEKSWVVKVTNIDSTSQMSPEKMADVFQQMVKSIRHDEFSFTVDFENVEEKVNAAMMALSTMFLSLSPSADQPLINVMKIILKMAAVTRSHWGSVDRQHLQETVHNILKASVVPVESFGGNMVDAESNKSLIQIFKMEGGSADVVHEFSGLRVTVKDNNNLPVFDFHLSPDVADSLKTVNFESTDFDVNLRSFWIQRYGEYLPSQEEGFLDNVSAIMRRYWMKHILAPALRSEGYQYLKISSLKESELSLYKDELGFDVRPKSDGSGRYEASTLLILLQSRDFAMMGGFEEWLFSWVNYEIFSGVYAGYIPLVLVLSMIGLNFISSRSSESLDSFKDLNRNDLRRIRKWKQGRDQAMMAVAILQRLSEDRTFSQGASDAGGIDLTGEKLKIQSSGQLDAAMMNLPEGFDLKNFTGFKPVIYSVTPVKDLSVILGVK